MSMPTAFQISIRYFPTTWIFFRSPPSLLFIWANQSATLQAESQVATVATVLDYLPLMPS